MLHLLLHPQKKNAPQQRGLFLARKGARFALQAFTLVEMLVVIALMVLLLALIGPTINSMTQSKGFTAAAYDIQGLFDQARSYAMGNNTYVYVGLLAVPLNADVGNGTSSAGTAAVFKDDGKTVGNLVAGVIASKDGTSGFDYANVGPTWTSRYNANKGGGFVMLGKIRQWEHTQLVALPIPTTSTSGMYRPDPNIGTFRAMNLGDPTAATALTPFSLPLGKQIGQGVLNFSRVVMFDPQGIARIVSPNEVDAVSYVMEVGLVPARGSAVPTATPTPPPVTSVVKSNCIALQFNAMTGSSKIYRP